MEFNKYKKRGAYHWEEYENQTAYGRHADKVQNWVRAGKILDIGAGDGLITHLLKAEGIDNNELAVKLAKEKGVNIKLGTAYKLEYPNNSFDNVLMADVIEHLEFPEKVMEEIIRVLKPNGHLYITTPPAKSNGLHDIYHYKEYEPKELIDFMSKRNFILLEEVEIIDEYKRMYASFISKHK